MMALTPGRSRWLAIGLLIILTLLIIRVALLPLWIHWFSVADEIDMLEQRRDVYERLVDSLPGQRERLETLQQQVPSEAWYLQESTPALAAASLQQLLHGRASSSGVQVVSTQIINEPAEQGLQTVVIQAHLRGDLGEVVDLLYTLESGQPLLFIDNLTLLANPRRAAANTRASRNNGRTDHLDLRMNLTGYTGQEVQP